MKIMEQLRKIRDKATGRLPVSNVVLAGSMMILVAAALWIGLEIWGGYRDSIINQQKEQMYVSVRGLGDNLEIFIKEYESDLDGLYRGAVRSEKDGKLQWKELEDYVNSHSRFVYDVTVENENGGILDSVRGSQVQKVYSESVMNQDTSLLLAELGNGGKYLILRRKLSQGAVSVMIDLNAYYETLIEDLRIGSSGYVLLKDAEGIILMHPEPEQWGLQVIDGREKLYPGVDLESLEQMIENQLQGKSGVEEYYSYWWMKPDHPRVRKICAYEPVWIGDSFLVISEVMDYDDIYIPIVHGVLNLILFFVVLFVLLTGLAFYVPHLMSQSKKDREKIAYLTKLNQLLEDMHRSEEAIAHQQRLQIMGTMTGGIAHEFNNLLTPIMGYADLLMMEMPEGSEEYENVKEIYDASVKAQEIIQQISSFSRKNMETVFKMVPAAALVHRALKMVRSVCPENISLEESEHVGDARILCNETQICQVMLNICVNAIHAIGREAGVIRVDMTLVSRDELSAMRQNEAAGLAISEIWQEYVHVMVQDNGCGMTREVMNQIFDPFFTTKKGGKGTGLGLSLVEQIVSSHKGVIYAESEPGEGSIFHICFPVCSPSEAKAETNKNAGSEKLRILMVDDNPKVLQLLKKDAGKHGVTVKGCMSFEEAVRLLDETSDFDLVAAEQEIGGKSAVEFFMSLQGRVPDAVKIVVENSVTREIAEARQRGIIDAYVEKPVSVTLLSEVYYQLLNRL